MLAYTTSTRAASNNGTHPTPISAPLMHVAQGRGSCRGRQARYFYIRDFTLPFYQSSASEVKHGQVIHARNALNDSQNTCRSYFLKAKTCSCGEPDEDVGSAIISRLSIASPKTFLLSPDGPSDPSGCNKFEYTKLGAYSVAGREQCY